MRSRSLSFTVAVTCTSRVLILRDRVLRRIGTGRRAVSPDTLISHHSITSESERLDAVFVKPAASPTRAVVLICHGIGETVEHWLPAQQLLAANGVASLVFDYAGYGKSTGFISWSHCERDAIAAFRHLKLLTPSLPISVLGFSLGSGIAAAIINEIDADHLILCAAFTSLRHAVCSIGLPRWLSFLVPPIWHAEESLRGCSLPVLVVHGGKDRLFPIRMASELASCCGTDVELLLVPDLAHNEPFYKPQFSYWGPIISRLAIKEAAHAES